MKRYTMGSSPEVMRWAERELGLRLDQVRQITVEILPGSVVVAKVEVMVPRSAFGVLPEEVEEELVSAVAFQIGQYAEVYLGGPDAVMRMARAAVEAMIDLGSRPDAAPEETTP
jgi:hypothetical protein